MEEEGRTRIQDRTHFVYNVKICLKKKKKKKKEEKLPRRNPWASGFDFGLAWKRERKHYPPETPVGPYLTKRSHNSLPRKAHSDLSDTVCSSCVFIIQKVI